MTLSPKIFPKIISAVITTINDKADAITTLDEALGDGDHVTNLQRGLLALEQHSEEIAGMDWPAAWQKIGMVLMSAVGGASGALYTTLFLSLHKSSLGKTLDLAQFAECFQLGVTAMQQRGKATAGEKTLLDVLLPVADALQQQAAANLALPEILNQLCQTAETGAAATRDMLATKGRAAFLAERSRGYIDPGAKTAELMIKAIAAVMQNQLTTPA